MQTTVTLSKEQARIIASAFPAETIRKYISEHQAEFEAWKLERREKMKGKRS